MVATLYSCLVLLRLQRPATVCYLYRQYLEVHWSRSPSVVALSGGAGLNESPPSSSALQRHPEQYEVKLEDVMFSRPTDEEGSLPKEGSNIF